MSAVFVVVVIVVDSKTSHYQYLLSYFFRLNALKGTLKPPTLDLLRLNTLRGTKTALLTPKKIRQVPSSFLDWNIPRVL